MLGLPPSSRVPVAVALVLALLAPLPSGRAKADTWDRIGRYAALIRRAGIETMVAKDCPETLLGAFHALWNALLLCANNLEDNPRQVWVVLALAEAPKK